MPRRSLKQRIREEAVRRESEASLEVQHARIVRQWIDERGSGPLPAYIRTAGKRWGVK